MRSSSLPESILRQLRDKIYQGKIRHLFQRMGINSLISTPYWKLLYILSENKQIHTIQNKTVVFRSDTFTEFKRLQTLAGEQPIIEDMMECLKQDDIFYDIGANIGVYTCFAAAKLGSDRVFAFEPEPKNISKINENIKLNDLDVKFLQVALSDQNGTAKLALAGDEAGEGEHAIARDTLDNTISVDVSRGDSLIKHQKLLNPSVIKVDVEGAESQVLSGLRSTLSNSQCRLCYVEIHPENLSKYDSSANEIHEVLESHGFELTVIQNRDSVYMIKGEK